MLSKHEEQAERLETIRNDQRVRNQGSTFSQFAASEAQEDRGRFTAHSSATVVGSVPSPAAQYPAAADWTRDPVPKEAQLGYSVNDLEACGQPHELKASSLEPRPGQASPGRSFISSVQATASPPHTSSPGVGGRRGLSFRRR